MFLRDLQLAVDDSVARHIPDGFVGRFERENFCVVDLYRSLLHRQRIQTGPVGKVFIRLFDVRDAAPPAHARSFDSPIVALGVCDLTLPFDFAAYQRADDAGRRMRVADTLRAALLRLAALYGWPAEPIEAADAEARRRGLRFEGVSPRHCRSSPDRRHRACLHFEMTPTAVRIHAVLFTRAGQELGRKLLIETFPWQGAVADLLGDVRWKGATRLVLTAKRPAWGVPGRVEVEVAEELRSG